MTDLILDGFHSKITEMHRPSASFKHMFFINTLSFADNKQSESARIVQAGDSDHQSIRVLPMVLLHLSVVTLTNIFQSYDFWAAKRIKRIQFRVPVAIDQSPEYKWSPFIPKDVKSYTVTVRKRTVWSGADIGDNLYHCKRLASQILSKKTVRYIQQKVTTVQWI